MVSRSSVASRFFLFSSSFSSSSKRFYEVPPDLSAGKGGGKKGKKVGKMKGGIPMKGAFDGGAPLKGTKLSMFISVKIPS